METGNDNKHRRQNQAGQHGSNGLRQHGKGQTKGTRRELAGKQFDENHRGQQEQVKEAL